MAFTLLMSVNSVKADVTPSWDPTSSTLTISGTGTITNEIWNASGMPTDKNDIETVTIEEGITSINDDGVFSMNRGITEVTIPASITSIGNNAFWFCDNLKTVTFVGQSLLTTIGENAFQNCGSLTAITIPENVTLIGNSAFLSSSLATVTFASDSNLQTIGEGAFGGTPLKSIELPGSVKSIGYFTFLDCTNLAAITIPASVTTIWDNAFQNCNNLVTALVETTQDQDPPRIRFPSKTAILMYESTYDDHIKINEIKGNKNPPTVLIPASFTLNDRGAIPTTTALLRYTSADGGITISQADNPDLTTLPACDFTWHGHNFAYWSDGTTTYNAGDSVPTANAWILTAQWTCTVTIDPQEGIDQLTVTTKPSQDQGSYVVNSKEEVSPNTTLRVYATAKEGYGTPTITVNGVQMTTDCFTVTGDTTVSATAKKKTYALTLQTDPSDTSFAPTVTDKDGNPIINKGAIPYGTEVNLKAADVADYTFMGWFLSDGAWVTDATSYKFTMRDDITYTAKYKATSSKTVTFLGRNQTVLKVVEVTGNPPTISDTDVPVPLEYYGLTFTKWIIKDFPYFPTADVASDITKWLQSQSPPDAVTVTASYTEDTGPDVTVTMKQKVGAVISDLPEQKTKKGEWFTSTAQAVSDAIFSHWELADSTPPTNPLTISTNPTVSFIVTKACTLTAVYRSSGGPSFELSRATYDGSGLRLEAVLNGVPLGSVTNVKFNCRTASTSLPYVACTIDPDGNGTYVANVSGVSLGTVYYIQPVATISGSTATISGLEIQVEPESGYDSSERACATIVESAAHPTDTKAGARFVAYMSVPEGNAIESAGVIASLADCSNTVLDFSNADYEKVSGKPTGTSMHYTWTKLTLVTGKTLYVRPYVGYGPTAGGDKHLVIGRRVVYKKT